MVELQTRKGDWMALVSGGQWWPFDPRPDEFTVDDIAHHCSMICRYAGATKFHYSIGQHSVLMVRWLQSEGYSSIEQLCALHHDASEPLSGFTDVIGPVKGAAPIIKQIEKNIWTKAIAPKFGLPLEMPAIVKEVDTRIRADERLHVLLPCAVAWSENPVPLGIDIFQWSPEKARRQYLLEHYRLQEEIANG